MLNGDQFEQPELPGMPQPTQQSWADEHHIDYHLDQQRRAALGPVIHVSSSHIPDIVTSGEYMSQHRSGTSRGMYHPERRRDVEHYFGWNHPIYGSIPGEDTAQVYGDTRLELHPKYREHTTLTSQDSLDGYMSTVNNPWGGESTPRGQFRDGSTPVRLKDYLASPEPQRMLDRGEPYVEAQIDTEEGSIPVSDITRATVRGRLEHYRDLARNGRNGFGTPDDRSAQALESVGVKVNRRVPIWQHPLTNHTYQRDDYSPPGPFDEVDQYDVVRPVQGRHLGEMIVSQDEFSRMARQASRDAVPSGS